ncbi:MAG: hypothetical protein K2O69_00950, partial [Odoribacter sp.]|nr:hypothetical protein [Odoribacter sp.]
GANEWCLPGAVSGSRKAQMKVMVEAYTGTDDRNVILTVKAGELVKTLTVTQKSVDALILTKDKIEVPAEGKDISVEVKTNVECTPIVPPAFQTWIKEAPVSKAMETKNFRFTVTANEDSRQREGYIVIDGDELKDTVHIYQAYRTETGTEEACLILSSKTHEAHAAGETWTVELKTNVDYEIMVPENASNWISCLPETRALRTDKLQLIIEANNETEERQAEVIVKDRNSELSDTLHIRQAAKEPEPEKPFLTLNPQNIEVEAAGQTVEVTVNTNIEYDVIIPQEAKTWITFAKGENNKIRFTITENQSYDESRQAKISIKASASELNGTVTISQAAKPETPAGNFAQTEYMLEDNAHTKTISFSVPAAWQVSVSYEEATSEWLSVSATNGEAGSTNLSITTTANTTKKYGKHISM